MCRNSFHRMDISHLAKSPLRSTIPFRYLDDIRIVYAVGMIDIIDFATLYAIIRPSSPQTVFSNFAAIFHFCQYVYTVLLVVSKASISNFLVTRKIICKIAPKQWKPFYFLIRRIRKFHHHSTRCSTQKYGPKVS